MRVMAGAILRFDSVTEMIEYCRARYRTDEVRSGRQDGEFVLFVRPAEGPAFESLIVHFEGERTYAVMLPVDE
ncbi:hypothetical protein [Nannocystis pusilla]|uniref:Uncharacterized protein n=1 Tax=Nannocystis pusilla TaxID=889268 RepID=A0ABS7U607_9BACT|nr:hypothetical protein [Nannocystis pusilla]MBZ5715826.1 hypothetical protein [Nannocystis pusilla]